jgi:hypothetical protein
MTDQDRDSQATTDSRGFQLDGIIWMSLAFFVLFLSTPVTAVLRGSKAYPVESLLSIAVSALVLIVAAKQPTRFSWKWVGLFCALGAAGALALTWLVIRRPA